MVQGYNGLASPGYNGGLRKIFYSYEFVHFFIRGLGSGGGREVRELVSGKI